jgi:hypothetical protein
VADGWCWFVLREKYCWLVAGGWFVVREKYCWLVADKPSEQATHKSGACGQKVNGRIRFDKLRRRSLFFPTISCAVLN